MKGFVHFVLLWWLVVSNPAITDGTLNTVVMGPFPDAVSCARMRVRVMAVAFTVPAADGTTQRIHLTEAKCVEEVTLR